MFFKFSLSLSLSLSCSLSLSIYVLVCVYVCVCVCVFMRICVLECVLVSRRKGCLVVVSYSSERSSVMWGMIGRLRGYLRSYIVSVLGFVYLFSTLEFFTLVFADGFSLEFELQQISSSLQDSSQYSGRPQQCCRLDSLHPSANFQVLQALNNHLVTVPNAPITIGTIVTFMFHSFFISLARLRYLFFFSLSFRFILWSAGTAMSTILQILIFLLIIMRSGLLAWIKRSVCMLKSHRSLCESFSRTGFGLCIYHLLVWSN